MFSRVEFSVFPYGCCFAFFLVLRFSLTHVLMCDGLTRVLHHHNGGHAWLHTVDFFFEHASNTLFASTILKAILADGSAAPFFWISAFFSAHEFRFWKFICRASVSISLGSWLFQAFKFPIHPTLFVCIRLLEIPMLFAQVIWSTWSVELKNEWIRFVKRPDQNRKRKTNRN